MSFDTEQLATHAEQETDVPSLRQLLLARPSQKTAAATTSQPLLGEVLDTHHPDFRNHVFVRWTDDAGHTTERWLKYVRGATPDKGDRVLLTQPGNWPEKLVTAIVDCAAPKEPIRENTEASHLLQLEQDKCLRVVDANDRPVVEIYSGSSGPVVRLVNDGVDIEVPGKLRLKAETLEFVGGQGGVDIRTEADTIVRSRFVRLN
ncbi:MAG: hypothetical protein HY308_04095 [Gammaproteobacteria bacterium]|nr:hypothetical protein [Gammaproteobacteria bacterium]